MPLPNNINAYAETAAVLEAVVDGGGNGVYKLPSAKAALAWRHRAYKYRLLLQKQRAAESKLAGYIPTTPYDNMKLTIQGTAVKIELSPQPAGELILPGGKVQPRIKPLHVREPDAGAADPLTEAALQLLAEKGEDDTGQ